MNYVLDMCGLYVKLNPTIKYVKVKIKNIYCLNPQSIITCGAIKGRIS